MLPLTLIQAENVLTKSMELAEKDPHGWIITVVSISVVFVSLALLFVLYFLFGRLVNRFSKDEKPDTAEQAGTTNAAEPEDKEPHDKESYVITIRKNDNLNISSQAPLAVRSNSESATPELSGGNAAAAINDKAITTPLPGVITSVKVKEGEMIKAGQVVAVLEAMKMENDLQSERDGKVKEVKIEKGDSVLEGAVIITLE